MSETTEKAPTSAFADALRAMAVTLSEIPAKLEGARVHDTAFGKLFEATEVRDAYHQRLPETENDLAEATEVIEHFIGGLEGGHSIAPRPEAPAPSEPTAPSEPPAPTVPAQSSGTAES